MCKWGTATPKGHAPCWDFPNERQNYGKKFNWQNFRADFLFFHHFFFQNPTKTQKSLQGNAKTCIFATQTRERQLYYKGNDIDVGTNNL